MARPKKEIDYSVVEKLAMMQCTQEEMASFLGISLRTFTRDEKCMELYEKGKLDGRITLRRAQFQKASSGNTTMLIWLGKQYLNQKDKVENEDNQLLANNIKTLNEAVLMNVVPNRKLEDFE